RHTRSYGDWSSDVCSSDLDGARMLVRFWGVRGSIPTPGRGTVHYGGNTPCVEVRAAGEIIVLDSGTGIRQLGAALTSEFNGKPQIGRASCRERVEIDGDGV